MVDRAAAGNKVVRLKGGDPMVFGRGAEELAHLAGRGIPVEVVPGVTSAIGVPTAVGIPLTLRGVASAFAVVAGEPATVDQWHRYAAIDTLVVLMGVRRRAEIAAALVAAGRLGTEPVVFIESGTTEEERVTLSTLGEVALGVVEVRAPAVWVIGAVVSAVGHVKQAPVGVAT